MAAKLDYKQLRNLLIEACEHAVVPGDLVEGIDEAGNARRGPVTSISIGEPYNGLSSAIVHHNDHYGDSCFARCYIEDLTVVEPAEARQ